MNLKFCSTCSGRDGGGSGYSIEAIVNASINLRTAALQGVPGGAAAVRGKLAAGAVAPGAPSLADRAERVAAVAAEHASATDFNLSSCNTGYNLI